MFFKAQMPRAWSSLAENKLKRMQTQNKTPCKHSQYKCQGRNRTLMEQKTINDRLLLFILHIIKKYCYMDKEEEQLSR